MTSKSECKICGASPLEIFAHTAMCLNCGVLLYYPYPPDDDTLRAARDPSKCWGESGAESWYSNSSILKHTNFTKVLRFVFDGSETASKMDVLDYGGGGGQFALVCKSQFINAEVFIVDIDDDALLESWKGANHQIKYLEFATNPRRFDYIFLNDLFEHLGDPRGVLKLLVSKLKPGGKIFIDTPRQFWLYPVLNRLAKPLYLKFLKGSVSTSHLQIWSEASFRVAVEDAGLRIDKLERISEYTMPADFYIKNMQFTNPFLKWLARVFYANAHWLARNKIICLLSRNDDNVDTCHHRGSTRSTS